MDAKKSGNRAISLGRQSGLALGNFQLTNVGCLVKGKPSLDEWRKAGQFLQKAEGAIHWWIGDWLRYGHEHYEHGQYEEALELLPFEYGTLADTKWVAGRIDFSLRNENLSFFHHRLVAALPSAQQKKWLARAEKNGWSSRELRNQLQNRKPDGLPEAPVGTYRCIVIDPPWPMPKIDRKEREKQTRTILDYPTMSLDEIQELPIPDLAADGCHLYLWVTQKFLPVGLGFLDAWGFGYQCVMTWVKPTGMTPFSWMYNTEHVLFGSHGSLGLERKGLKLSFEAAVVRGTHSTKPSVFYDRVRAASPEPRLEMFARKERKGFVTWGDEA